MTNPDPAGRGGGSPDWQQKKPSQRVRLTVTGPLAILAAFLLSIPWLIGVAILFRCLVAALR